MIYSEAMYRADVNRWKRTHRRKTMEGSRLKLAYNVPGTREHGELASIESNLFHLIGKDVQPVESRRGQVA